MKNRKQKKTGLVLWLVLVLSLLALTGCGKNTSKSDVPEVSPLVEAETSVLADTKPEETATEETKQAEILTSENANTVEEYTETEPEHAGTLVVFFSATGHTKPLAEYAAEYLNADLFEIVPEEAYTEEDLNYNDSSTRATREQNDAAVRPAIAGPLPDLSGYDTVIIGHPIWWGQAPKIIYTFLESYDWSGKTLATFCTSASSGLGSSAENVKRSASGNPEWMESRRFSIGTGKDEVADWLQQILPRAVQVNRKP